MPGYRHHLVIMSSCYSYSSSSSGSSRVSLAQASFCCYFVPFGGKLFRLFGYTLDLKVLAAGGTTQKSVVV